MKWTYEKIRNELKEIFESSGQFPTIYQLQAMRRSDLTNAIRRDGRGLYHFQELFGCPKRKPVGYWNDRIDEKLSLIVKQFGRFPTQKDLVRLGNGGIYRAIKKTGLTLNDYRRNLGFDLIERDKKYWKDWRNLENELKPLIMDKVFPSTGEIYRTIGGGCLRSINKFGGIAAVSGRMGCKRCYFQVTRDGHYVRSYKEYIFDEFLFSRGIGHEVNGLISQDYHYRYDFKVNDIYFEIWGFDCNAKHKINVSYAKNRKKKEGVYRDLGLKLVSIEYDVFEKPFDETEQYLCGLLTGLGFDTSKLECDYNLKVINHYNVWDESKVLDGLKEVIQTIGHMPTFRELIAMNKSALRGAIHKYGGMNHFASKLGTRCKRHRYWTDERITSELLEVENELGHFPKMKEIRATRKYLAGAISERGGIGCFRNDHNFKPVTHATNAS